MIPKKEVFFTPANFQPLKLLYVSLKLVPPKGLAPEEGFPVTKENVPDPVPP